MYGIPVSVGVVCVWGEGGAPWSRAAGAAGGQSVSLRTSGLGYGFRDSGSGIRNSGVGFGN